MKKIISLTLVMTVLLLSIPVSALFYPDDNEPIWYYTVKNNVATVSGYYSDNVNPVIPDTVGEYPVTTLSDTFRYKASDTVNTLTKIKSVVIPSSVTKIDARCFHTQDQLESINIPQSVTLIGENAFIACSSLSNVTFEAGSSLTTIGNAAFYGCTALGSIDIPDGVQTIQYRAFYNCNKLEEIVFPAALTTIGAEAFSNTSSMKTVTFKGTTAPTLTAGNKLTFPATETVYYPEGATGYDSADFRAQFAEGTVFTASTDNPSATDAPSAIATPEPTATPEPMATPAPTATPTPRPTTDPNAVHAHLGYGASFRLFPSEISGADVSNATGYSINKSGAVIDDSTGQIATGPYTVYDTAPILNFGNGVSTIKAGDGGKVNASAFGATYNKYAAQIKGAGTSVLYEVTPGLLDGVDTLISVYYMHHSGATGGLDAVVTYDGGRTSTVNIVPAGTSQYATRQNVFFEIGTFKSIESVELISRGNGDMYIPAVQFLVVNDNPGTVNPDIGFMKYLPKNIEQVFASPITLLPTENTNTPVSLNEICSSNKTLITDYNGKYSDYIELYNSSDDTVDLAGWGLSDNPDKLFKWTFPDGATIAPYGYLVVFASGNNTACGTEYHTNYNITRGGETIILSTPEGGIADIIDLPVLEEDSVMARYPDGNDTLKTMSGTPSDSNTSGTVTSSFVSKPGFSHESGIYADNFNLTLSSQNGTIHYTTDGSVPTLNSPVYSEPISVYNRTNEPNDLSAYQYTISLQSGTLSYVPQTNIDKITVVRAAVFDNDGNMSDTVTKSYLVGYDMKNDFNNAAVLSVTTDKDNLFDDETGIFTNADLQNKGKEWEREAHLDLFESNGSLVIDQNCGIRVRGLSSLQIDQKGINFYARSEYGKKTFDYPLFPECHSFVDGTPITQYRTFCVRNGSMLNDDKGRYADGAMQGLTKDIGGAYQEFRNCVVFLNGEYWGQYYLQERVSTDYMESHFGIPEENLMLIKNHESKGDAAQENDISDWYESSSNYGRKWLSKTDFSIQENYDLLCEHYDIQNLMYYYAANMAMVNRDWGQYNYACWRSRNVVEGDPYQDGRWRFLMYDCDAVYQSTTDNSTLTVMNHPQFVALIGSNESLKRRIMNCLCDVYSYYYDPVKVYTTFNYYSDELLPMLDDLQARYNLSKNSISASAEIFYDRVTSRPYYYYGYLAQGASINNQTAYLNVRVNNGTMGRVKVNTIEPDFKDGRSYTGRYFTEYTQDLVAIPEKGYKFVRWEGTGLSTTEDETTEVTLSPLGSSVVAIFAVDEDSQGTAGNPFVISTPSDLAQMAANINNAVNYDSYYVLANDIDMTGVSYTVIGVDGNKFKGSFDGQGHVIRNLTINDTTQGQGVFGYTGKDAVIKNLGVENITINGGKNVGGIVGNNNGTITDCYSTGMLSGDSTVGGITGNNKQGTVINCFSMADIVCASESTASGIAGKTEADGTVTNCYALITPVSKQMGTIDIATRTATPFEFYDGTVSGLLGTKWKNGLCYPVSDSVNITPEVNITVGENTVNVISNIGVYGKLVICAYNGNSTLSEVITRNILGSTSVSIPQTMSGKTINAFFIEGMENIRPIK